MRDIPWTTTLIVLGATALGALLAGWLGGQVVSAVARRRRSRLLACVHERCQRPWQLTLLSVGLLVGLPAARLPAAVESPAQHLMSVVTIAVVSWLVIGVLRVVEDAVVRRVRMDTADNRRARKLRTQIAAMRRLGSAVITVLALAAILMSFETMRAYGASVLASAGVAGLVAGLAAQTTLSNVFAGLQMVFTDALRIDDVVVVEGEWGRIEELTLTYVVVHLWDERRLVLPATYFNTTPFQNWTRTEARVLGSVVLFLDPATPVPALRDKAREVVAANPLWDRRDWVLQVTDMTERSIVVRVLASASDAPSAWDLRCDIREELLSWLRDTHPEALPRLRTQVEAPSDTLEDLLAAAR